MDTQGCDLVNMSIGFSSRRASDFSGLARALANAASKNRLIVCAVGASSGLHGTVGPLAGRDSVLSVGAVKFSDDAWHWSGTNEFDPDKGKPELCAPGNSTSMATPVVTGLAAVLLGRNRKAFGEASKLKQALIDNRIPIDDMPTDLESGIVRAPDARE